MRWKRPEDGDIRIFSKFLFFPTTINSNIRWLEKATYEARYTGVGIFGYWKKVEWL